jgi:predicted MFS family arabinose efflux permease
LPISLPGEHLRIVTFTPPSTAPTRQQVAAGSRATFVAFIGSGFAFANWAARIPQVRDGLELSASELGLVLFTAAAGSVIALPLAGAIVHRLGSRRTVEIMAFLCCAGLAIVGLGFLVGVIPVVLGLLLAGFGFGAWDVAMNVQGAMIERHLARAILPRFHAGFSVGTVAGALVGAGLVAAAAPVTAHLLVVAVGIGITVLLAVRSFIPDRTNESMPNSSRPASRQNVRALVRWKEPRTLLIGVSLLAFTIAEGSGFDWISVALIDGYGVPAAVGTLGFAAFVTAMTALRWFGTGLLDRYGRVAVVRTLAVVGAVGVMLFVISPNIPLAFAGILLWGAGASVGFPVGISAVAEDPAAAAGRVSVVSSIAYCAFLAGPPLIGFLGEYVTILRALTSVAVALAFATLIVGSLRPLAAKQDDAIAEEIAAGE